MTESLQVEIDPAAGFCFGVARAVHMAEEQLKAHGSIWCLGSLVHNNQEVLRLENMGLKVIGRQDLKELSNTRVLIRAHGEPPETYAIALKNNIELIDATCKVVLRLQGRIHKDFNASRDEGGQLVIYGKQGHPEVDGLMGQTAGKAILIDDSDEESLARIDFSKPISLYCQTTQSLEGYARLVNAIKAKIKKQEAPRAGFSAHDTICRQVAGRGPRLREFAGKHDVMVFVSGRESSNGRFLFDICRKTNAHSYMVSGPEEVQEQWFHPADKVGVSGATSTPQWLMEAVADRINSFSRH
ncbi:MAG: 4-hydroxy-3-methylbut-2-enyl diphosphate reductase [Bacteroidales bacterium]